MDSNSGQHVRGLRVRRDLEGPGSCSPRAGPDGRRVATAHVIVVVEDNPFRKKGHEYT